MTTIATLIISVIALILEALPFGAVLRFAAPVPTDIKIKTYSYFDLTPFGYANFGPFFTALLTAVLFILLVIYASKNKGLLAIRILSVASVFTSLLPLIMYGTGYYTITAAFISALLLTNCVLLFTINTRRKYDNT